MSEQIPKEVQAMLEAIKAQGLEAKVLMPGTPEYEDFKNQVLENQSVEAQAESMNIENKIMLTDISKPSFQLKHKDDSLKWASALANNNDPYGKCCFVYANLLAKNLEALMLKTGKAFKDLSDTQIKSAEREADEFCGGITGFMYGIAIGCLSDIWLHGDELKAYHNAKYNQPEAKGVVNPAIITVGK